MRVIFLSSVLSSLLLLLLGCASEQSGASAPESTSLVDSRGSGGTESTDGVDGTDASDGADARDAVDATDLVEDVDGTDASDGVDGADTSDGTDASDGVDGADTSDGTDASDGVDAGDGTDGSDATGTDGTDGPELPCGSEPTCECLMTECVTASFTAAFACETAESIAPECLSKMLSSLGESGCGATCGGVTIPALDALCADPLCESFNNLLFQTVGASDLCGSGCACEPDCTDKACGDDGCGGSCGGCMLGSTCVEGECVAPEPSCDDEPDGCSCAVETCIPILSLLGTPGELCFGELIPPVCSDVVTEAFVTNGCGEPCKGYQIPGLEKLCGMPECDTFVKLAPDDLCQCFCEPDCDGKSCGGDGCGGSCGECADGETCGFGECLDVAGECTGSDYSCFCGMDECKATLPSGSPYTLCAKLSAHPACQQAVMLDYAEKGCGSACTEMSLVGQSAMCSHPDCEAFRLETLAEKGLDVCASCE